MNTPTDSIEAPVEGHFVPLGHAAPAEPGAEQESAAIMADMAGGESALGDLGAPKKRVRVSSQIVLMVSVLVLSAAALYFMRKLGTGAGMTFVQPPIEFILDAEQPDRLAEHEKLLSQLESLGLILQIPTDDVDKNPFQLIDAEPIEELVDDPDAQRRLADKRARELAEQREREINKALGSIIVHSILNGARPVANVNDGLVGIGDVIENVLTVVDIKDRYIVVEADGEQYTIQMKERQAPPQRKRPRRY